PSARTSRARSRRWRSHTPSPTRWNGLPKRRLVRQAPQADGRLGGVLRQDRDGRGQGGRARSWTNTAIASPKARGGRPAVAHPPPSMCLPRATYLRRDGGDGGAHGSISPQVAAI